MNNKDTNIISSSLKLIKECPVCHTHYDIKKVQILDYSEDGVLVYFFCPICLSSLLANIIEMPFGVIGSAMLTDLEADEVLKFKKTGAVTVDDVLQVYQM